MLRAIKYELCPNKSQRTLIKKTCGCARLIYNLSLAKKNHEYEANGSSLSEYDLNNELTKLKRKEEYNFLNEVPSQALQQSIHNLSRAFTNFFKNPGHFGFPKFKKKGVKDSFRIPVACEVDYLEWKVKVAKLGWVKFYKGHNKKINGIIKSYTISRTSTDRYYISILYETADRIKLGNNKSVGIDLGIKSFAVLSSGEVFENQKYLKQSLAKLKVLQRSASRKYQKGKKREDQSNNWKKAMMKVSKLHERIRFQRKDYLEKVSTWISRNYSTVCVESLEIQKMMKKNKHHNLSGEIGDCGWGMFLEMLSRKCDQVLMIDTYFPSSQTCSVCGHIEKSVKNLNVRTWVCPVCGSIHDRDFNAAQNILREGLSLCGPKVNLSSTCPKIPSINSDHADSRGSIVRTIGVDFDNTIVIDEWPEIGALIPGAIETLKELQARGHRIILYTQRNDDYYMYCPELVEYGKKYGKSFKDTVDLLSPAVKLLSDNGISPDAINENPWWEAECQDYGRKVYFDVLIDDHNAGITRKTIKNSKGEWCEVVDWDALREWLRTEGIL